LLQVLSYPISPSLSNLSRIKWFSRIPISKKKTSSESVFGPVPPKTMIFCLKPEIRAGPLIEGASLVLALCFVHTKVSKSRLHMSLK